MSSFNIFFKFFTFCSIETLLSFLHSLRPNPKIPSNYGHTTGYLSMKNMTLGNCNGFTKVQDVHLHGINGATQEELNEISSLLKQGVIL